jgi:hypothetical protein
MKLRSLATTYAKWFGDEREHDFTALDTLIPHPGYGRNHRGVRSEIRANRLSSRSSRCCTRPTPSRSSGWKQRKRQLMATLSASLVGGTGHYLNCADELAGGVLGGLKA